MADASARATLMLSRRLISLLALAFALDARVAAASLDVVFRTGRATADGAAISAIDEAIGRDRSDIAFRGSSTAIVARTASGLSVIARSGDPLPPPLDGTFGEVTAPALNANGLIVFTGNSRLFAYDHGTLG